MRNTFLILCCCFQLVDLCSAVGQDSVLSLMQKGDKGKWGIQLDLQEKQTFDPSNFKVYTTKEWSAQHQAGQAIAGRTEQLSEQSWAFIPHFPFTEGMEYVAFYPGVKLLKVQIPKADYPLTDVIAIYPNQDTIPENLLKMYLYFSAPMSVGNSYKHLHWYSGKGDTLNLPFLQLEPELWNEDRTRLTLWLDPGRVKRDLIPNQLLGGPLVNGEHYVLQVDQGWKDRQGNPIKNEMVVQFAVGRLDRNKPKPNSWKLLQPSAAGQNPLILQMGDILDYALLQHTITVWSSQEQQIAGRVQVNQEQTEWHFYPDLPWASGDYYIKIDSKLEDLAGNNLNRLFDVDLQTQKQENEPQAYHYLPFTIK
ncbi:MAG: hypothetical protein HRU41_28060 [Saprospiraceae bacterium]|nr:hypothetical protein [Saprospiraceae bacterium]